MRPPNWDMYVVWRTHNCLRLLAHEVTRARLIALVIAGRRRAARIPMMTMTTSSSTRVNPLRFFDIGLPPWVAQSASGDHRRTELLPARGIVRAPKVRNDAASAPVADRTPDQ